MKTHVISVCPEVFKQADLAKVKELKKSTNIDFAKDSYSEIRDVVTTLVHNHMTAATKMDVDTLTHIMSMVKAKFRGESEHCEDKPEEDHDSEQHGCQDEEGRPTCYMEKELGKSKEQGNFDLSMLQLREDG